MELLPNSPRMDKQVQRPTMERILNLTLKIIYLLTGENYGPQRKSWEDYGHPFSAGKLRSPWSPYNELKILELTNKIIELLTGEISIRWHDVAVYFSMEEWKYLVEHKDLYEDIMENHQTIALLDISETEQVPERSHNPIPDLLTGDVINIQPVKCKSNETVMFSCVENFTEEPTLYKEACRANTKIHVCTPTHRTGKYSSTYVKDELFSGEEVTLTNTASYTSTIHIQQDLCHIKKESVFCDGGPLSDTDIYSPTDHAQCLPTGNKEASSIPANKSQTVDKLQECPECDMCFTSIIGFVEHQLIHTREKSYTCPDCKKSFGTDSEFVLHLRLHQREKKFTCAECGKSFKRRTHLSMHEKIHTGERPYLCKECGKCFIRHSYFIIHQRIHTGEKPYSCSECQKRFTSKPELVSHQRIHTGEKPFLCTECGKCFNSNKSLYRHRMSHTGERPFPCTECGKCLTSRRNLNTHLRSHTGEKPFSCDQCGRFFTCKRNLQSHQRLHTGEKPFYCAACRMRFTNKAQLLRHQQAHIHHNASILKEDILMTVVDDL